VTFIKEKTLKIRKNQYCIGCYQNFEPGSSLLYCVYVVYGDLCTSYWCDFCHKYYLENLYPWGDFDPGEFATEKREFENLEKGADQ